jgi:hypothetical protein
MYAALRHPRQPLRLHLVEHRVLLLLSCVVPEQPSLEGGARAAEAVGTAAVAQMGSEGRVAFALSPISRGLVGRSAGVEVSAFESEQYACAIVACHRGGMEGGNLLASPCIDNCFCFHQDAADLSVPLLCSEMEGHALPVIHCIDRCSCFHQNATDLDGDYTATR